jgi:hypothetical protein
MLAQCLHRRGQRSPTLAFLTSFHPCPKARQAVGRERPRACPSPPRRTASSRAGSQPSAGSGRTGAHISSPNPRRCGRRWGSGRVQGRAAARSPKAAGVACRRGRAMELVAEVVRATCRGQRGGREQTAAPCLRGAGASTGSGRCARRGA